MAKPNEIIDMLIAELPDDHPFKPIADALEAERQAAIAASKK